MQAATVGSVLGTSQRRGRAADPDRTPANLNDLVESVRLPLHLPGLAGAVMREGRLTGLGVAGVRRLGAESRIEPHDRFGIGSLTKRFTGLTIARLVDAGRFTFDSPLATLLPGMMMRDEYRAVTVEQLLRFTGGIATYERIGPRMTPELFDTEGTVSERQARFIRHVLQLPPVVPPGREARYSNASYALLGFIAASVTGRDFRSLVEQQALRPLGLASAGWGRPNTPERPNEPWQHLATPEGYRAEPDMHRPPEVLFEAAGGLHLSVPDLALLAQYELDASSGRDRLLADAVSRRWHGRADAAAAAPQPVIRAGGTPWQSAMIALWPAQRVAAAVAINGGSPEDAAGQLFVARVAERERL